MIRSTWCRQLLCAVSVVVGLGLTASCGAQDKKEPPKGGGEGPKVIVIQIDASKLPPDVLKQLMALSQGGDKKPEPKKEPEKKPEPKKEPEKKPEPKKEPEKKPEPKKEEGKKPNIVQVDLNQLPPGLAKQIMAELAKSKEGKKEEEKKGEKKKGDDDDDDKKGKKKSDDDDKKGEKKKD